MKKKWLPSTPLCCQYIPVSAEYQCRRNQHPLARLLPDSLTLCRPTFIEIFHRCFVPVCKRSMDSTWTHAHVDGEKKRNISSNNDERPKRCSSTELLLILGKSPLLEKLLQPFLRELGLSQRSEAGRVSAKTRLYVSQTIQRVSRGLGRESS